MKNRRVLVTGSSGAIGGALKDIAAHEYPDCSFSFARLSDCDLTDQEATHAFIAEQAPDAIIHLAARAGGVRLNANHPATLLRDNLYISVNVLEAARKNNVQKTVMALSSGIYPPFAPRPFKEEDLHAGYPDESNYGYAFAKRIVDPLIRAYRSEYDMNVIGLLPNNTIGEHSSFREDDSGVVPALIRRFYENRVGTEPIQVWGNGTAFREISYAKDIARIFMWSLDNYNDNQVLNIGTSEQISIEDIAQTIAATFNISSERIQFTREGPDAPLRKETSMEKMRSLYPYVFTPARTAITSVAHFFAEKHSVPGALRL